jgi:hypothetical protein
MGAAQAAAAAAAARKTWVARPACCGMRCLLSASTSPRQYRAIVGAASPASQLTMPWQQLASVQPASLQYEQCSMATKKLACRPGQATPTACSSH